MNRHTPRRSTCMPGSEDVHLNYAAGEATFGAFGGLWAVWPNNV